MLASIDVKFIFDSKTNLKQGPHIHQPTAWPVPHACAQPYHPGSGSHGQLFRPYWSSLAWHSRRVYERGKSPCINVTLSLKGVLALASAVKGL